LKVNPPSNLQADQFAWTSFFYPGFVLPLLYLLLAHPPRTIINHRVSPSVLLFMICIGAHVSWSITGR
jgi:hypothetical protein